MISSPLTAVYNPKAFIPHAASLRQAFAHYGKFSTAATRRCPDNISIPVMGAILSHPLNIITLVGHYPTNKLISRKPLLRRNHTFAPQKLSGITHSFPWLFPTRGHVPTNYYTIYRFPLKTSPKKSNSRFSLDLHA